MSDAATVENAAMERQEYMDTKPQDRYSGRLKSACCPICGGVDGMQATHREVLAQLDAETITLLAPWHRQPGNSEHLFHACDKCNRRGVVPAGYERVRIIDIPGWLDDTSLMQPDYAALARKEPVSQIGDSRESAGL